MGNNLLNRDGTAATEGRRIHPDFPLVLNRANIEELCSSLRLLHHQACDRAAYVLEAMITERELAIALVHKTDQMVEDSASTFFIAANHGCEYSGAQIGPELEALRAELGLAAAS